MVGGGDKSRELLFARGLRGACVCVSRSVVASATSESPNDK